MNIQELVALKELSNQLKANDIKQITDYIGIPEGLCQEITEGSKFLTTLKKWSGHNPFIFYQTLKHVRADLVATACKIKWLCVTSPEEIEYKEEEKLSIKTLIEFLKSEISKANWELIYMVATNEAGEDVNFETTLNKLLEKGLIEKDLTTLIEIIKGIQRGDLEEKLEQYRHAFGQMEDGEFESKFKKEVGKQAKELEKWEF